MLNFGESYVGARDAVPLHSLRNSPILILIVAPNSEDMVYHVLTPVYAV